MTAAKNKNDYFPVFQENWEVEVIFCFYIDRNFICNR